MLSLSPARSRARYSSARTALQRGFTLVELMIVVAIVGVLAALAVYGVNRYVRQAKTAEARGSLGRIGKDAAAAFERSSMSGSVLAFGASSDVDNQVCTTAWQVPGEMDLVRARKYQSGPADWEDEDPETTLGWECLRFTMSDPQYYQYHYEADEDGEGFTVVAQGDLDGDGVLSRFELRGDVGNLDGERVVKLAPNLVTERETE